MGMPWFVSNKVEGSDETKWVLIVSIQKNAPNEGTATSYFVGDFDGKEFKSDKKTQNKRIITQLKFGNSKLFLYICIIKLKLWQK